jgi:hypothetical protein
MDAADLVLADLSRPIQVARRLLRESLSCFLQRGTISKARTHCEST